MQNDADAILRTQLLAILRGKTASARERIKASQMLLARGLVGAPDAGADLDYLMQAIRSVANEYPS